MEFMEMLTRIQDAVWGRCVTLEYSNEQLEYLDAVFPAVSIDKLVHMDMDIGPKDTKVTIWFTGGDHLDWTIDTDTVVTEMLFALMVYGLRETHKVKIWSYGEYIIVCAAISPGQRRVDDA